MRKIEAPPGSYRFMIPETYGAVQPISGPAMLDILPTEALMAWMDEKNIPVKLEAVWETNDLHFNLTATLEFQTDDDAIIFKLTWIDQ